MMADPVAAVESPTVKGATGTFSNVAQLLPPSCHMVEASAARQPPAFVLSWILDTVLDCGFTLIFKGGFCALVCRVCSLMSAIFSWDSLRSLSSLRLSLTNDMKHDVERMDMLLTVIIDNKRVLAIEKKERFFFRPDFFYKHRLE